MTHVPRTACGVWIACAIITACGGRTRQLADVPLEYTEFVVQRGDSVVATEKTTRWLTRLEGEIEMPGRARAVYVATITGPGTMTHLDARLESWTEDPARPPNRIVVELLEDSVRVRTSRWEGVPVSFAGAVTNIYLHPSPALLELILRRAFLSGDSIAEVGVWLANQNTRAIVRVTLRGALAEIEFGRALVHITHDDGYIVRGEVPSTGWVFRRRSPR